MRIQKISTDKVVVQLTDADLEHFDLDFEKRAPQAADLHKLLFRVMDIVKDETGFDAYRGGQVVVEATPLENGISLIITKIRTEKEPVSKIDASKVKGVRVKNSKSKDLTHDDIKRIAERLGITKNQKNKRNDNISFVFDSFDDFESAVFAVSDMDFEKMRLYRKGKRYALVAKYNPEVKKFNILSEYSANISKRDVVADGINEGWKLVAQNGELRNMASELKRMK